MPPIPQQQGSRAGLITALVILAILFVAATALFIVQISEAKKAQQDLVDLRKQYETLLPEEGSPSSQFAEDLRTTARTTAAVEGAKDLPAVQVLAEARRKLAQAITGEASAGTDNALGEANAVLKAAAGKIGNPAAANESLNGMISKLAGAVADAQTAAEAAAKAAANSEAQMRARLDAVAGELKKKDEQIAVLQKNVTDEIGKTTKDRTDKETQLKQIEDAGKKQIEALQESINQQQVTVAAKENEIKLLKQQVGVVSQKLAIYKLDPKVPIAAQADATVTQISADGTVYIDIGQGDQVSPGLTFEVFSRGDGVPKVGDPGADEAAPMGKASIEVIRVGASSSECRVTRKSPGVLGVAVGDLCVNIVYDRHTKLKFFVHGKFDLDQNSVATDQDALVVKRLIGQWGGQSTDKIDINTDFVVLGIEPTVPELAKDEETDATKVAARKRAEEELAAYHKVIDDAARLHIPIMNQNRFLYFVGFYNQARK